MSKRGCRHPMKERTVLAHYGCDGTLYDCNICGVCRAWLPLGPSRDTPETAIELRAAEIAAAGERRAACKNRSWNCCRCTMWNAGSDRRCYGCKHKRRPDTADGPPPREVRRPGSAP